MRIGLSCCLQLCPSYVISLHEPPAAYKCKGAMEGGIPVLSRPTFKACVMPTFGRKRPLLAPSHPRPGSVSASSPPSLAQITSHFHRNFASAASPVWPFDSTAPCRHWTTPPTLWPHALGQTALSASACRSRPAQRDYTPKALRAPVNGHFHSTLAAHLHASTHTPARLFRMSMPARMQGS